MSLHTQLETRRVEPPGPDETARLDTAGLRHAFLLDGLFAEGEVALAAASLDGMVAGEALPREPLCLPGLLDEREAGIVNLGAAGVIRVGQTRYELGTMEFLYAGLGGGDIEFHPPGVYYLVACPAHARHAAMKTGSAQAQEMTIGDASGACLRTIRKFIAPGTVAGCQLVMGYTELAPGSVWNTMPAHTHHRRSEIYLYCGLGPNVVFHFLGQPGETRHLVVRDREAVLSPRWSIHSGAGTASYKFVWAMAGENQDFADIDPLTIGDLR